LDLAATDRKITPDQGKEFAAKHGMEVFEVSAKTRENIDALLDAMARKVSGVETSDGSNVVVIKETSKPKSEKPGGKKICNI